MNHIAKLGDILQLENNESYNVAFKTTLDNKNYLGVIKLESDIEKLFNSNLIYVEEIVNENDEFSISPVKDAQLIEKLNSILKETNKKTSKS